MPKPFDFGGVNLTAGEDTSNSQPSSETPFRIAILGDLSGRANREILDAKTIPQRRAVLIDRDNFDDVLSRMGVELAMPLGDGSLRMHFRDLEDFHPDHIFQNLQAFAKLRELRARVQNPATFPEAADELGLRSSTPALKPPLHADTASSRAPSAARLASTSLLDEMIEQTESRATEERARSRPDEVHAFAQRVAAPHLVSAPDSRQPEVLKVIDRGISALMRSVLHNQEFQALEAIWRAAFFLVRQLETGPKLKVYVFDISKQELTQDLKAAKDLRSTGMYRLLVEQTVETPGAEPWALILGNYRFGPTSEDAATLAAMSAIGSRAGAPFVAAASARFLGCSSLGASPHPREWKMPQDFAEIWAGLRRGPAARYVALALPRFLLRLPYGDKTSSIESFEFEEFVGDPEHEDYLWGNPAFVVALLLAQSFSEAGWKMHPGTVAEIGDLPLHIYATDGRSETKSCAEILLTDEAVERVVDEGLMPLIAFKNQDRVRVVRFQSIAEPSETLAGRWNR